ncbi:hypothetical protein XfCFBP8082_07640 [Xylella fastidiosa subsp. fastidiosa]|nr:hypothetical protein [Xylella fastidiosa subsp. fastidiosa]QIS25672.1 hypothetical protein F7G16_05300 [Xylella fastidiosa]RUA37831.1 hypothetical protein DX877_04925 [Xylella fastidiosa subsp. fastidiosa]RUA38399.1 hypothetical protein DX878_04280 [Xylella fastidiosa subsp. fastidiosa]RWA30761.1 hypothetical protein XfCFBP8071_07375 [Xylella fastidiosa subsp. fastidiosa]
MQHQERTCTTCLTACKDFRVAPKTQCHQRRELSCCEIKRIKSDLKHFLKHSTLNTDRPAKITLKYKVATTI